MWPGSTVLGSVGSTGFMIFLIKLGFVIWLDFAILFFVNVGDWQ